jgi:glycosyltransferase involved in cell wall biosynthesis
MLKKKKLKIAILTEGGSNPTGTFYGALSLAEGLQKLGCEVYLITTTKMPNINVKQLVMKWPIINMPLVGRISWFFSLYFRLKRHNFDVIHSYGYGMINLLPFDRYKDTLKVTTIGDLMCDNKELTKGEFSMVILAKVLQPPHLRFNDIIITYTEETKPKISRMKKVALNKISVVPLAIAKDFHKISDKKILVDVRKKYDLPKEFILNTGNLKANKNIVNIIKAFKIVSKKLPKLHLVFSGRLNPENKSYYNKKIIAELDALDKNTRDKIVFLNYVSYEDLKSIYTLSKGLVMPSLEEGFGVPLLEAMNCEIPIVTSNISCMPEIVEDAAIVCNPYSHKEIASSIEKIVVDEKLRKMLIVKGIQRAKYFKQEKTASLTYNAYVKNLENKKSK